MDYENKFVLTLDEVLEALGSPDEPFPASSFYALKKTGKAPNTFKIGRRSFCLKSDFESWLSSRSQGEQP